MSTFGTETIARFPSQSPIHNPNNPGHIMIDDSIGRLLDEALIELEHNSDQRFLVDAEGVFLDRYGEWFGVPRGDMGDDEYRIKLLAVQGSNISISGVRGALSIILDLDPSDIIIRNSDEGCCRLGKMVLYNQYHTGPTCRLTSQYTRDSGTIMITVPIGTDTSVAKSIIGQMILPGVIVNFKEAE